MSKGRVFALSPVVWGVAFALFVLATRNTLATDVNMVVLVVTIELILLGIGFLLALAQLPAMVWALAKGHRRLAGFCALGLMGWFLCFFIGMGLGPALIYVT